MKLKLSLILFISFLFSKLILKAQENTIIGFHFKNKYPKQKIIPFELQSNLIVIKVKIDQSDTLNFILDTGVGAIIITDPLLINELKLKTIRQIRLKGIGENDYITAGISINHAIHLNGVSSDYSNILTLDQDLMQLSNLTGIKIHGLIGYDIFNQFVVQINYKNKEIILTEPHNFKYRKQLGIKIPLDITHYKPFISNVEIFQNNKVTNLKLLLDTGNSNALILNTYENKGISLPEKNYQTNLGFGLNGILHGKLARLEKLRIKKYELRNIIGAFPLRNEYFDKNFRDSSVVHDGSIGGEILNRFTLTFNYAQSYVCFKSNKQRLKKPFESNMSGISVKFDTKNYVIDAVDINSDAYLQGVRKGAIVKFINGQNVNEMDLNAIRQILKYKEGSKVSLVLIYEGKFQLINFKLKKLI